MANNMQRQENQRREAHMNGDHYLCDPESPCRRAPSGQQPEAPAPATVCSKHRNGENPHCRICYPRSAPLLNTLAVNPDDLRGIPDDARVPCANLAAVLNLDPLRIWQTLWRKANPHETPVPAAPAELAAIIAWLNEKAEQWESQGISSTPQKARTAAAMLTRQAAAIAVLSRLVDTVGRDTGNPVTAAQIVAEEMNRNG